MTILGLQSSDRFRAERRFNATHGWAPGFDESRFDSYENIRNQQRSHAFPYNRTRGLCSSYMRHGSTTRSENDMAAGTPDKRVTM